MSRTFWTGTGIPLIALAIEPKTPADARRLADGLAQLLTEDASLRVQSDRRTGRVVISTSGEQHLEIIVDRLKRDFNVAAAVGRPQVVCREALRRAAEGEAKYVARAGDRRLYAHVKIRLYPGEAGAGYVFQNQIVGGAIPAEFIAAVEDGIQETLARGVLAGHPIADARVELCDGSYHDADSNEEAFRTAGSLAARDAAVAGEPVVLEPVMRVEIVVPPDSVADVLKDLQSRRGRVESLEDREDTRVIRALVPLAELFGYPSDLQSRTRGRGSCTIEFERYEPRQVSGDDDARGSFVAAPLEPRRPLKDSSIALPEPDDDIAEQ